MEWIRVAEPVENITNVEIIVLADFLIDFSGDVFIPFAGLRGEEEQTGDAIGIIDVGRGIVRQDLLDGGIETDACGVIERAGHGDVDGILSCAIAGIGVVENSRVESGGRHGRSIG